MLTFDVGQQGPEPKWAGLQRSLIHRLRSAAPEFVRRMTRTDGSLIWKDEWPGIDGSDDPYEGFQFLALLGAITHDREIVRLAHQMWEAITWQWTEYGQLRREFDRSYDWMHHGEANSFLYYFGFCDPTSLKMRQRAARFTAMYDGTDPTSQNYDPELGIITSPQGGSDGPLFEVTAEAWSTNREVFSGYHSPFEDLASAPFDDGAAVDWTDDAVYAEMLDKTNARLARGDVPVNLNATSLFAHTYMLDGRPERRDWVIGYLRRWLERAQQNDGILPDNVGPNGIVGELLDGKWWGGHYGWRWPHGWRTIIDPVVTGCLNAHLLTGDDDQLQLVRMVIDTAWNLGRAGETGWEIPHKHFDSGWTDYQPMDPLQLIQLWSRSQHPDDLARVERLRAGDWTSVTTPREPFKTHLYFANTLPWFDFVRGRNPGHLERVLQANHDLVDQQLRRMRSVEGDPHNWPGLTSIDGITHPIYDPQQGGYNIHLWQEFSPVHLESLIQTVFGAPAHLSRGGLQFATVRPFDTASAEPGLPEEIAMAVTGVDVDHVDLELACRADAETDAVALTLQAGGYREHEFISISGDVDAQEFGTPLREVTLRLQPGAVANVRLGLRRMAHAPSYETPFSPWASWPQLITGRPGFEA